MLFKDNSLSTILILVALGFLIYHLMKPGNCDTKQEESFTEHFVEEQAKAEGESVQAPMPVIAAPVNAPVASPVVASPSVVMPEVNPEVIQQALAESLRPETQDVFQFQGASSGDAGASLDAAFEKPAAPSSRAENVDMNKENTKKYNAADFLPKEVNSDWFDTDFSQAKVSVGDDKLINTDRYVIGINTVGQSLKNASYDIRGTIANPKFTISPWNNSTYEPDFNLKSLC
jgi:hypothetical protein